MNAPISERDAVLRERAAYLRGIYELFVQNEFPKGASITGAVNRVERCVASIYQLPMVERHREAVTPTYTCQCGFGCESATEIDAHAALCVEASEPRDFAVLERLAREVTPGPWRVSEDYPEGGEVFATKEVVARAYAWAPVGERRVAVRVATASFIAAANPDVIRSLLSALRDAKARVKALADAAELVLDASTDIPRTSPAFNNVLDELQKAYAAERQAQEASS